MKYLLPILLVTCSLWSCKVTPETYYDKEGLSFTCPSGWSITEEEDLDGEGYYLSVEQGGFNGSGLLTITWLRDEYYLDELIQSIQEDLSSNFIYRNSNLKFDDPLESSFNNYDATVVEFTASVLGVKHRGSLIAFYINGKTVTILKQEALEDVKRNKEGFRIIESSFTVKEPNRVNEKE